MAKVIRRCPYCKQDISMDKGLSSENIKRLFRKPTLEDMIILIVLTLTIVSFLAYNSETKAMRAYINENCTMGQHNQQVNFNENPMLNISNLNQTLINETSDGQS